jgi:Ser/Thr protein kinase RdoA (MazF antagonist)
MPAVIGVEPDEGWLLMQDLGAAELGHQDPGLWYEGLVTLARMQQHWLGRASELHACGLPDRSLESLAAEVEAMAEDTTLLWRLPDALRDHWLATVPALLESCHRLADLGPEPTLVHGDFHPWNLVHGPEGTRIFDWTDAAVSHPFVDLATYVFRTKDVQVRRRLVDAYVEAWSRAMSPADARQAAELGLVVGSLYQVQTYRRLLPALMADGKDDGMSQADLAWIKRTLERHERGVESTD